MFHDVFPSSDEFKPHISLIYKTMPKKERMNIIAILDIQKSYEFGGIAIVETSGSIDEWKTKNQVIWNK